MFNRARYLALSITAVVVGSLLLGCGGDEEGSDSLSTSEWRSEVAQLCTDKREAVANLGFIRITERGIEQAGLPAAKQKLDVYLGRLLAVSRRYRQQRERLTPPAELRTAARQADAIGQSSETAIVDLRKRLSNVTTTAQFTAAFNEWLSENTKLTERGNAIADRLDISACKTTD